MAGQGTYNVNEPDTHAIARTDAKLRLDKEQSRTRGKLTRRGKEDLIAWKQLEDSGDQLSVLNRPANEGLGIFTAMLKADGAGLDATGRYSKPQKPQFTGSAITGGIFPDNQLKYAAKGNVLADAAVGATFGGLGGMLNEMGQAKLRRAPDAEAMVGYLSTPEGVGRMSGDPQFARNVLENYADEYKESLGLKPKGNVGDVVRATGKGALQGAAVGTVAGQVRHMLSGKPVGLG